MTNQIHVVVGGQYGSEAKGHVAAQLGARIDATHAVRIGGPNAGHTVYDAAGRRFALRTLPVAAAMAGCEQTQLVIAAGSEIQLEVLFDEIVQLRAAGHDITDRLWIDPEATIIDDTHLEIERSGDFRGRFGSTAKGIGAARAARLLRTARRACDIPELSDYITDTATELNHALRVGPTRVVIEGTQGYGLGLHAGRYPFCTAGDCRAIDCLAQAGLHPSEHASLDTWVVFRTYPIRVAGNSGPLRGETDWETLGAKTGGYIQEERTTVTQLVRRVGAWDPWLADEAMGANGSPSRSVHAVLMFCDYLDPELAGATDFAQIRNSSAAAEIERMASDCGVDGFAAYGTGPTTMVWAVEWA